MRVDDRYGHATFSRPAPGVALLVFHGGLTEEVIPPLIEALDAVLAECESIAFFVDGEALTSYTPAFRKLWSAWLRAHRSQMTRADVLVRSAIVRMGLSLVNALVGNTIQSHESRSTFDRAIAEASAAST